MMRLRAALIHFFFSLAVFSALFFIIVRYWYPVPFFTASGGWQGLKIVALVDVVLGPLLTFVVFSAKKCRRELLQDLSIIVLVQVAALAWGVYTVHGQRPVAVVFWENKFYTVPASSLVSQGVKLEDLVRYGKHQPRFVYAKKPTGIEEIEHMVDRVVKDRVPPHQQLELYRPFNDYIHEVVSHSVDIYDIIKRNNRMKKELEKVLSEQGKQIEDYHYVALESKYHHVVLVLDDDGGMVGSINAPVVN